MKVKVKIRYFLHQHWKSHVCEVDVDPKLSENARSIALWDACKDVLIDKYMNTKWDVKKISITQVEVLKNGNSKA